MKICPFSFDKLYKMLRCLVQSAGIRCTDGVPISLSHLETILARRQGECASSSINTYRTPGKQSIKQDGCSMLGITQPAVATQAGALEPVARQALKHVLEGICSKKQASKPHSLKVVRPTPSALE